jgi:hypothetical protein
MRPIRKAGQYRVSCKGLALDEHGSAKRKAIQYMELEIGWRTEWLKGLRSDADRMEKALDKISNRTK